MPYLPSFSENSRIYSPRQHQCPTEPRANECTGTSATTNRITVAQARERGQGRGFFMDREAFMIHDQREDRLRFKTFRPK